MEDTTACFSVEDDGPGCEAKNLPVLTSRGLRLDERVDGHGLGLSIAADIVELYAGNIHIDRSPQLGGLRVRVSFPTTDLASPARRENCG